ncbi:hypothetical protein ACP_1750 [Acidobacterium capsulatum ATCC 51196]|uniref:Uncharacterized protein n=1 Tax=Acidobacterium capsulatum (strain ATCC 51196 / DSM 11244 / BCRC 80197 / JCM 7670 / NBRC 15755 / NCIMB 13165 / 161) TaxID=240015 RepID=C1F7M0_ACIC5|nr:hypothetical protein ACP_1750 [Acidobacterium capsulatum ATCC 51196]
MDAMAAKDHHGGDGCQHDQRGYPGLLIQSLLPWVEEPGVRRALPSA